MENIRSRKDRAKRIQHRFTTRIRLLKSESNRESDSKWNLVTMRDLSSSGINFNFNENIPINTVIEFNMSLPFSKDVHCLGKVCRVTKPLTATRLKKIPIYAIGVQFIDLDNQVKACIDTYSKMFSPKNIRNLEPVAS